MGRLVLLPFILIASSSLSTISHALKLELASVVSRLRHAVVTLINIIVYYSVVFAKLVASYMHIYLHVFMPVPENREHKYYGALSV